MCTLLFWHLESSSMSFSVSRWLARHACCECVWHIVIFTLFLAVFCVLCICCVLDATCLWDLISSFRWCVLPLVITWTIDMTLSFFGTLGQLVWLSVQVYVYFCCLCFVSLCYRDIVFLCVAIWHLFVAMFSHFSVWNWMKGEACIALINTCHLPHIYMMNVVICSFEHNDVRICACER